VAIDKSTVLYVVEQAARYDSELEEFSRQNGTVLSHMEAAAFSSFSP